MEIISRRWISNIREIVWPDTRNESLFQNLFSVLLQQSNKSNSDTNNNKIQV